MNFQEKTIAALILVIASLSLAHSARADEASDRAIYNHLIGPGVITGWEPTNPPAEEDDRCTHYDFRKVGGLTCAVKQCRASVADEIIYACNLPVLPSERNDAKIFKALAVTSRKSADKNAEVKRVGALSCEKVTGAETTCQLN